MKIGIHDFFGHRRRLRTASPRVFQYHGHGYLGVFSGRIGDEPGMVPIFIGNFSLVPVTVPGEVDDL